MNIFSIKWVDPKIIGLIIFSSILSATLTTVFLKKTVSRPAIMVVDIKQLVRDKVSADFIKNTPEGEIEKKFNQLLKDELNRIKEISSSKNVIILSKEAVLYGAPEITSYFKGERERQS